MDVMSMCSLSSPKSSPKKIPGFASTMPHVQSLPSPPLMDTANEKKGSSLPPLTSILRSPVPPLHEINPNPTPLPPPPKNSRQDTSSASVVNHNFYQQSSTPLSPANYPRESIPQSMARRSSLTSSSSSSSYTLRPVSHSPNDTSMWSSQPPSHPTSSYYQHPPPRYPYTPQSQHHMRLVDNYNPDYPPPYATSISYTSTGNYIDRDDDSSPYIQQTTEQSIAKMGKVVDHCNQIAYFASQYRDMKMNYNPWNGVPQITESHLTSMINRAYDVLNILSGLKGEITASTLIEASQDEIDLIRKQRTLGASARTKYRKRSKRAAPPGRCHSCNISETPEWRRGPDGARTLCNACGLHFAKITRKRALSVMQQAEQQQQQQQHHHHQQQQQQQATSSSSNTSNINSTAPDNSNTSLNNNSSMPTPGASDVERESPHAKRSRIEAIDD